MIKSITVAEGKYGFGISIKTISIDVCGNFDEEDLSIYNTVIERRPGMNDLDAIKEARAEFLEEQGIDIDEY